MLLLSDNMSKQFTFSSLFILLSNLVSGQLDSILSIPGGGAGSNSYGGAVGGAGLIIIRY